VHAAAWPAASFEDHNRRAGSVKQLGRAQTGETGADDDNRIWGAAPALASSTGRPGNKRDDCRGGHPQEIAAIDCATLASGPVQDLPSPSGHATTWRPVRN
jgi:hypothetical protein